MDALLMPKPHQLAARRPSHRKHRVTSPRDAIDYWRGQYAKPLFVYFIQDERGAVKIGKAYDPVVRLAELQCGNPFPLELRAVIFADYASEANLHFAWGGYRLRGEWFGGSDRYKVYGYLRILPPDHPSVQDELIRLAQEAQSSQIEAALAGASEQEIHRIVDSLRPPEPWVASAGEAA